LGFYPESFAAPTLAAIANYSKWAQSLSSVSFDGFSMGCHHVDELPGKTEVSQKHGWRHP
jgi:hypothetical protein